MIHIIYKNINFVLYLYFCTNVVYHFCTNVVYHFCTNVENHLNPKGRKPSRYCFRYNEPSIIFGVIEEEKYSLNKLALLSQIQPKFDQNLLQVCLGRTACLKEKVIFWSQAKCSLGYISYSNVP